MRACKPFLCPRHLQAAHGSTNGSLAYGKPGINGVSAPALPAIKQHCTVYRSLAVHLYAAEHALQPSMTLEVAGLAGSYEQAGGPTAARQGALSCTQATLHLHDSLQVRLPWCRDEIACSQTSDSAVDAGRQCQLQICDCSTTSFV